MNTTYAQKSSTVQKAADTKAASVLDSSAQNESLQRKADMTNNAAQRAEAPRPNNTGMPDNLKSGIESLSGFSMDNVRVHYNSSKPATVQALAYTQGTDIHVAPGQEKCLPHEAWHVAQQMAGRVSPTTNINGMPMNDNAALEHEADVMGEEAVQCKMVGVDFANGKVQNTAVQRMACAKINEDGTVSAETKQSEGNKELAGLFGRELDQDRPDNVARKVDQYKKEMLTYIANLIEYDTKLKNGGKTPYGAHISVTITRGIWFVSVNSDFADYDTILKLQESSFVAKDHIITLFQRLNTKVVAEMKEFAKDKEKMSLIAYNPDEESAKKQALYIAYRWAAKNERIVVTHNECVNKPQNNGSLHGEMKTLDFIRNLVEVEKRNLFLKTQLDEMYKETLFYVELPEKNETDLSPKHFKYLLDFFLVKKVECKTLRDETEEQEDKASGKRKIDLGKKLIKYKSNITNLNKLIQKAQCAMSYFDLCEIIGEKDRTREKKLNRVIRVGGTLTACHDCAYEIGQHNKPDPDEPIASVEKATPSTVHKVGTHLASEIGGRRAVTMTLNSGAAFDYWKFKNGVRQGGGRGKYNPDLYHLAHDKEQNQDYNELCDSFNSMKLGLKMCMFDSLKTRLESCLNPDGEFGNVDEIMMRLKNEFSDENKKKCFDVKK